MSNDHRLPSLALLDDLEAVAWEADPETLRFTEVHGPAEDLLGYEVTEWLVRPTFWLDVLHPQDRARAVAECRMAVDACVDHVLEYRAVAADGRTVWLRDIVRVTPDHAGRPVRLTGMMLDVTAQREAEEELDRVRLRHHALRQHSHELTLVLRRDGVVIEASPSLRRLLGLGGLALLRGRLVDVVHPEDRDGVQGALLRAAGGDGSFLPRFRCRRGDEWRVLEGVANPLSDARLGAGVVVNVVDVTALAEMEDLLLETNRREILPPFIGRIAHDLNNSLMTIVGLCQVRPGNAEQALRDVESAAARAAGHVKELAELAIPPPAGGPVVDASSCLSALAPMIERAFGAHQVECLIDPERAPLRMTRSRFEALVLALVTNAADAMPEGGPLTITTRLVDTEESSELELVVEDAGLCTTGEDLATPSARALGPSAGRSRLGVATARAAVEAAGGRIHFDSAPGRGTRVVVSLPTEPR